MSTRFTPEFYVPVNMARDAGHTAWLQRSVVHVRDTNGRVHTMEPSLRLMREFLASQR